MISALAWVPRGAAKAVPASAAYTEEELAAAKAAAEEAGDEDDESEWEEESSSSEMDASGDEADGGGEDGEADKAAQIAKAKAFAASLKTDAGASRRSAADDLDAAMAELDMDHYDSEEEGEGGGVRGVFGNTNPGMAYYANNEDDPYLKLAAVPDDDSERDDFEIRGDDFLLLAARTEDEVSHLEVWVYEEADEAGGPSNMYVHHDTMLTAFPLCLAWLDCPPGGGSGAGNLAAVGTMGPGVEVWDLDVVDAVEPSAMLGGELLEAAAGAVDAGPSGSKKKKKKKKGRALRDGSHSEAVLALSWNREFRNVLASGSADATVKVWDVAAEACSATLAWHSDKVQAVAWNPADAPVLLSGGFDRNVFLGDARAPSGNLSWECSADVEALAWDPHNPLRFLVSGEDGIVAAHDARGGSGGAPLFRLSAHDKPACCLSFNAAAKGLLATASTDKQVKLWDVSDNKPSLVAAHELKAGALFTGSFCPERPNLFAAGGAKGELVVWDVLSSAAVASRYGKELAQHAAQPVQAPA